MNGHGNRLESRGNRNHFLDVIASRKTGFVAKANVRNDADGFDNIDDFWGGEDDGDGGSSSMLSDSHMAQEPQFSRNSGAEERIAEGFSDGEAEYRPHHYHTRQQEYEEQYQDNDDANYDEQDGRTSTPSRSSHAFAQTLGREISRDEASSSSSLMIRSDMSNMKLSQRDASNFSDDEYSEQQISSSLPKHTIRTPTRVSKTVIYPSERLATPKHQRGDRTQELYTSPPLASVVKILDFSHVRDSSDVEPDEVVKATVSRGRASMTNEFRPKMSAPLPVSRYYVNEQEEEEENEDDVSDNEIATVEHSASASAKPTPSASLRSVPGDSSSRIPKAFTFDDGGDVNFDVDEFYDSAAPDPRLYSPPKSAPQTSLQRHLNSVVVSVSSPTSSISPPPVSIPVSNRVPTASTVKAGRRKVRPLDVLRRRAASPSPPPLKRAPASAPQPHTFSGDGFSDVEETNDRFSDEEEEDLSRSQHTEERSESLMSSKGKHVESSRNIPKKAGRSAFDNADKNSTKTKSRKGRQRRSKSASDTDSEDAADLSDPAPIRKSTRQKVEPLQYWKNERIIYGRSEEGPCPVPVMKGVIRAPPIEPVVRKRKRAGSYVYIENEVAGEKVDESSSQQHQHQYQHQQEQQPQQQHQKQPDYVVISDGDDGGDGRMQVDESHSHARASSSQLTVRSANATSQKGAVAGGQHRNTASASLQRPNGPSKNRNNMAETIVYGSNGTKTQMREVACTKDMFSFRKILGNSYSIHKGFQEDGFMASGVMKLPPGSEQPLKSSKSNGIVFYVISGKVKVQVHKSHFSLKSGGSFHVPRENQYRIQNIDPTRETNLFFVQTRSDSGVTRAAEASMTAAAPTTAPATSLRE